jgi:aspartate carbamoyltransferase regulatory subunit
MNEINEKLSVSAIKNGTVIDHILAGQALRIIKLLSLQQNKTPITVGMHLLSDRMGSKDIIKIENRFLTHDEANEVVVFAPLATINIIENFKVITKIKTRFPSFMKRVFICPNHNCISLEEPIDSHFYIEQTGKQIKLTCHYCRHAFDRDHVQVRIG